jgi:nicotinate phosphoribosyltransferase
LAARATYLAGFAGTATVMAAPLFGIPVYGTMAHSFVQAHDDEAAAFDHFAHSLPENVILLIDTYDTEAAAQKVVRLAPKLMRDGIKIKGVRLDSGDLAIMHSRSGVFSMMAVCKTPPFSPAAASMNTSLSA